MQQPTMPSYPNATSKELGRWYSYRITFILVPSEGVDRLKFMLLKAAGHNLVSRQARHITVDRSMLDFELCNCFCSTKERDSLTILDRFYQRKQG